EPNEDAIKRVIELLRIRKAQMDLQTATDELAKLEGRKDPVEFGDIAAELAFQQFELERDLKLERDQRGDGKFLSFAQSDMAESRNYLDKTPLAEIGQQQMEATAEHLEKAVLALEQAFEKAADAADLAETPEQESAAQLARKLAGESADHLRKLISKARNTAGERGNVSDLLLDLGDLDYRIQPAQEEIKEIEKEINSDNCDPQAEEDLAEAKKALAQALKDKNAKQKALTEAIRAALKAAVELGKEAAEAKEKRVPAVEKAANDGQTDAAEEIEDLKTALAEAAKRAQQAAESLKKHEQLAADEKPAILPPTGKPTASAQKAVILKIEREIKELMQSASGQGESGEQPPMDPETLKLLMEMMRMLQEQGLMPESSSSQSQSQGSSSSQSQGNGQGNSPGQSNAGGTTNRTNPIEGDGFNRNDPSRETPQASGAGGRVPSEYQDKIQAYLRALRARQNRDK
ncbi:MAG: hypothetical protein CMO66_02385, partial [Verrucomicrobiales bacterium]|nr:hypothetical protein [Verrucomicrobiales bacterium]